jgi:hypothetical protein
MMFNYYRIAFIGLLLSFSFATYANEAETKNNPRIIVSKITKKIDGHQYQILSSPKILSRGIKLVGKSTVIKMLNAMFLKDFIADIDQELSASQERENGLYAAGSEVVAWNNKYITVLYSSEYDGSAHPNVGQSAIVYNLNNGKRENIDSWFNQSLLNERHSFKYIGREEINSENEDVVKKSVLGNLLKKTYIERQQNYIKRQQKLVKTEEDKAMLDECASIIEFGETFWPTKKGFTFLTVTPYADRVCIDNVILPYCQAMPFLSKKGKQAIQAFRK